MSKQTRAGRLSLLLRLASRIVCAVLLVIALLSVFYTRAHMPTRVYAQSTSSTMNFQGRLLSASGSTVPDGYYNLQFKLYTTSTNGTGTNLWTETYYDANGATAGSDNRVRVVNGYFSVNLGSQTAFSGINWDQELWLTMNVGGPAQTATPTWDGEMLNGTLRTKLTAVPYAFTAGQLAQSSGANRGTLSFNGVTNNPDIRLPDIAGTNNVLLQSGTTLFTQGSIPFTDANGRLAQDNTNFFYDDANNRLGLGTASPQATLHVNGTVRFEDFAGCTALETDADGDLVCGTDDGANGAFVQGGNSFTAAAILGTNDNFDLEIETFGTTRVVVQADGDVAFDTTTLFVDAANDRVGIGDVTPAYMFTVGNGDLTGIDSTGALGIRTGGAAATADLSFGVGNRNINVLTQTTANGAGGSLTISAGAANGSTTGNIGGDLNLNGGAAAGSGNNNGGAVNIQGGAATGTGSRGHVIIQGAGGFVGIGENTPQATLHVDGTVRIEDYASCATLATDADGDLVCGTSVSGDAFLQGGNSFSAAAYLGTNDNFDLNIETFGVTRLTVEADGDIAFDTNTLFVDAANNRVGIGDTTPAYAFTVGSGDVTGITSSGALGIRTGGAAPTGDLSFGIGADRTINVLTQTTNTAGNSLTVKAGNAGSGASAFSGGQLILQGGDAAGTGNANGGNIVLSGGAGTGTGVKGLVVIDTPTFTAAAQQNCTGTPCALSQASVDSFSTITVHANAPGYVVTLPAPTNTTAGRIVYVTAVNGSADFTLSVNGGGTGNLVAMRQNSTATMVWNGSAWAAAGASSSTTLQAAYDNTLTSAGGAEIVLNAPGGSADGLTIRNNPTTPIVGGLLEVQTSIGSNLFSVNNFAVELATNGGGENSSTFATDWAAAPAGGTVTRTTTAGQFVTGQAGIQVVTTGSNHGARNNLASNPAVSTTYQVSFTAKLSSGTFTTLDVQYSRDGGTDLEACTNYSTQTLSTSVWTKITCTITTDATTATNPDLIIRQTDATGRTFWIDNLSFQRNDATANTTPSNVQIGGGINGGPVTLLTLDRSSSPPVPNGDSTYYGSMYYDTVTGRIQCYEADGWGACGSAPDNIITLTPEYAGAVLNGTGVGTMTADFCANGGGLTVNTGLCNTSGEARNFYKWTSPQATSQTYSIYVTYKLPNTFKTWESSATMRLTAYKSHATNSQVTMDVYKKDVSSGTLSQCGTNTTITTSTGAWDTTSANGDETTCGFEGGDYVIFKINLSANSSAAAYVENLDFTFSNR